MVTRRRHHAGDTRAASSGGLLGFDELFRPTADGGPTVCERQQEIPASSPTLDAGPRVMERGIAPGVSECGIKIVIEIAQ